MRGCVQGCVVPFPSSQWSIYVLGSTDQPAQVVPRNRRERVQMLSRSVLDAIKQRVEDAR